MKSKWVNYKIDLPREVEEVLNTLTQNGFEAFVVGGSVRDIIMGEIPSDWDIATNAVVEEISNCFGADNVLPIGIQHGTVGVRVNSHTIEVTTYRIDGVYSDYRHPEKVEFAKSLKEDLSRRDFTVNAMAYSHESSVVDYFGGMKDIEEGIIRCVGAPEKRLKEDALRILRGVRFASVLDFSIEEETAKAIDNLVDNLDFVSKERVREELNKAVMGKGFKRVFSKHHKPLFQIIPELKKAFKFNQNTPYHIYDVYKHILVAVEKASDNIIIKLTMLFHDIGKPHCYTTDKNGTGHFKGHGKVSVSLTENILNRLKYSNKEKGKILKLVKYHDLKIPAKSKVVKKWLNRLGEEGFKDLLLVQRADAQSKSPKYGELQLLEIEKMEEVLDIVLKEKQCFSVAQLEIDGNDIINLELEKGPQIGWILSRLVDLVIDEKIENKKEELLKKAIELINS